MTTPAAASSTTLDKVWLLEAAGAPVHDTAITFAASAGRTIVMRHAQPDNAIFLILDFPPWTGTARTSDSIHVSVQPVANRYAFALQTSDKLGPRIQATFSYAIHFQEPTGAHAKYPSPGALELALAPAQLAAANKVQFIVGNRPAADVIRFPVAGPGSFALVVAR